MSGGQDSHNRDELFICACTAASRWGLCCVLGLSPKAYHSTKYELLEIKQYVLATYITFVSTSVGTQSLVRLLSSSGSKAELKRVG